MPSSSFDPPDLEALINSAFPGVKSGQMAKLLADSLIPDDPWKRPEPQLHSVPDTERGFRIRLDLLHVKPPVWRRIEVPGSIELPQLHNVIQAAMGWTDSHLHRFRTGNDHNAPEFLTQFDLDEGDEGMLEDGVRLDQIIDSKGDRLWYDYDFGDGWEHVLRVEQVLDSPPQAPMCTAGRLACPPEDCGGISGYSELADWARGGYTQALLPEVFDSIEHAQNWLPLGWHPDAFDLDETNAMLALMLAEPAPVTGELAELLDLTRSRGSHALHDLLTLPQASGPTEVGAEAAAEATAPFSVLLDVIGDGTNLTNAGYLRPADVEQIALRVGITEWWIGKANREDLTWPVAHLRAAARSLGLVSVRKGRIAPTQAARRCEGDPEALLRHIIRRLPLGKPEADRVAGWVALAVVGSETPVEHWDARVSSVMYDLGWRDGRTGHDLPPAGSPTLDVLQLLADKSLATRQSRGVNPTVAAVARAAMRGE